MGGDAAAKSGGFVGFEEPRLVMAGAGAMGALHTPAAMLEAVPWHAPGCQQRQRCQCWPVARTGACCNKNHSLLQHKTQLPSRSQAAGEEAAG